jgi:hypothetical protein
MRRWEFGAQCPLRFQPQISLRGHRKFMSMCDRKLEARRPLTGTSTRSLLYSDSLGLFGSADITRVNVTPPAAFEFVCALDASREMMCINCSSCGYPHLDLGDFARTPHRKHFCGNCGRDSTWSKDPIVSTPLKPLHDEYAKSLKYETANRTLNIDDYRGCSYTVWASTPAIVWTASRPQEFGIHVHVHDGQTRVEWMRRTAGSHSMVRCWNGLHWFRR